MSRWYHENRPLIRGQSAKPPPMGLAEMQNCAAAMTAGREAAPPDKRTPRAPVGFGLAGKAGREAAQAQAQADDAAAARAVGGIVGQIRLRCPPPIRQ